MIERLPGISRIATAIIISVWAPDETKSAIFTRDLCRPFRA